MNEKIKELALQAEVLYDDGEYLDQDLAALQKFAELIATDHNRLLKVALNALQSMRQDYLRKDGLGFDLIASSTMFGAIEELEKHFGVAE